jgi:hypothetical protein
MRFSAMLAEEYILIVPFAYQLQSGLDESRMSRDRCRRATEYNINCINFTQQRFGLTNHGISAQQKALTVGGKLIATHQTISGFSRIHFNKVKKINFSKLL